MRMFKRVATVAMMAGLVAGTAGVASASAATRAPESASQVSLTGGHTSVTTAPGIAAALLGHGIVPLATLPGTEGASIGSSGVAVTFTFPVTGGYLNAAALKGTIRHQGGGHHQAVVRPAVVHRILQGLPPGGPGVVSPARREMSTAASVWPLRCSTPPGLARSGKMWPGRTKSARPVLLLASARTVAVRSSAEIPVVVP